MERGRISRDGNVWREKSRDKGFDRIRSTWRIKSLKTNGLANSVSKKEEYIQNGQEAFGGALQLNESINGRWEGI